jgi:hypothetical protein
LVVAAHAVRRANRVIATEAVTVLTRRRRRSRERTAGVQRRMCSTVTALAERHRRWCEARIAMTVTTRDAVLRDMHGVPCTLADVLPRRGNDARRRALAMLATTAERDPYQDQRDPHRAPSV